MVRVYLGPLAHAGLDDSEVGEAVADPDALDELLDDGVLLAATVPVVFFT